MQINVETLSSVKKKINFVIPAERVSQEVDKAYGEIKKYAAVKGFRKGKVPMGLIEKHYGDKMAEEVLKTLVNDTYYKAVADEGLNPVSFPVIESDALKPGEAFNYSATIEVFPKVELKEYVGLELEKEQLVLDQEAVNARLAEMQQSMAQLVPAQEGHAAALGDFVVFDFTGSIDGVPFEGGAAEDFQLELGSGRFIPGFEDQMVGLKAGDSKDLNVTFPEQYGNDTLRGKPAVFAVTVKEIKVKELPELDDEFAKEFGEFDNLDALKAKLAEIQKEQEEHRVEYELKERMYKQLVEKNELEVPETLVDRQVEVMLEQSKQRLAQQRLTLEMMGLTEDAYKAQFRDAARDQVKSSLILDAVAEKENIEVTDADFDARVEEIAQSSGQDKGSVAKHFANARAKESLTLQLREEKAADFIISKAVVVERPKAELKA
ncbi:trigger factor [Geomesophilobacter sediminis]|uniref:Trigger factor n=1 Tax=Geomesophilobacter sediminis TaxID=2798584 RepID=A0A8J7JFK5_9BACT|nr:trigger factor [Geomesophilobacter sediminis]MBJ6726321.1 trigger factor [Geomesophilobacter sediminis]